MFFRKEDDLKSCQQATGNFSGLVSRRSAIPPPWHRLGLEPGPVQEMTRKQKSQNEKVLGLYHPTQRKQIQLKFQFQLKSVCINHPGP
jgi:hypothetical protein